MGVIICVHTRTYVRRGSRVRDECGPFFGFVFFSHYRFSGSRGPINAANELFGRFGGTVLVHPRRRKNYKKYQNYRHGKSRRELQMCPSRINNNKNSDNAVCWVKKKKKMKKIFFNSRSFIIFFRPRCAPPVKCQLKQPCGIADCGTTTGAFCSFLLLLQTAFSLSVEVYRPLVHNTPPRYIRISAEKFATDAFQSHIIYPWRKKTFYCICSALFNCDFSVLICFGN